MLKAHFSLKYSSRLPVIAIFTVYQELLKVVKRYENKILKPLNVHTSSDKKGFGDIEIFDAENNPFEIIEVKHNIPIDRYLIFDIAKKTKDSEIQRYYVLTTADPYFAAEEEENFINQLILKIKKEIGLEIIANGILHSLKYYLRFIDDYDSFLANYTKNLVSDAKNSTEITTYHLKKWQEILKAKKDGGA